MWLVVVLERIKFYPRVTMTAAIIIIVTMVMMIVVIAGSMVTYVVMVQLVSAIF